MVHQSENWRCPLHSWVPCSHEVIAFGDRILQDKSSDPSRVSVLCDAESWHQLPADADAYQKRPPIASQRQGLAEASPHHHAQSHAPALLTARVPFTGLQQVHEVQVLKSVRVKSPLQSPQGRLLFQQNLRCGADAPFLLWLAQERSEAQLRTVLLQDLALEKEKPLLPPAF